MAANWPKLLIQYWGYCGWLKTPADADDAVAEMRQECNFGLKNAPPNDEMCDTIRHLAGPEGRQGKCPTLRELMIAVRMQRNAKRGGAGMVTDRSEGDPESIKAAMTRLHDHESRWDWLCDHVRDLQTADTIKEWAERQWPGFGDAAVEYKRDMIRRNGSAWRMAFDGPQQSIEAPRCDVLRVGGAA